MTRDTKTAGRARTLPAISIALATCNGARYLPEQLASLASQRWLPYELVVTDDGSTDGTPELVEIFAQHAPFPVRLYRNAARLGYAENFLLAASHCRGDWIAFCDQDDVWRADKLERVAAAAAEPGVTLVAHRVCTVDQNLQPLAGDTLHTWVRKRGSGPGRVAPFGFFAGMKICFDAALLPLLLERPRLPNFPGEHTEVAHDEWASLLGDVTGTVRVVEAPLVAYRQHGKNACGAPQAGSRGARARVAASGAAAYRERAAIASQYRDGLAQLAQRTQTRFAPQLLEASRRYEAVGAYLLARASLYESRSAWRLTVQFVSMCMHWRYRYNPLRPGVQACAKDFVRVARAWLRGRRTPTVPVAGTAEGPHG
ncbi:glycosyltransferase [Paraburkholderia kururiensis]|uniref:Glycosyltransferase n=1 Tax=Paraburkholderia kururiensis TaxID=984307 RepID=A0ABZ0WSC5_9BURK|nr:glycosyltransferase [Paraburkholderia kururiensis]WQD80308.1 glycosyltransferase [Paraburkholderia kururiensis]